MSIFRKPSARTMGISSRVPPAKSGCLWKTQKTASSALHGSSPQPRSMIGNSRWPWRHSITGRPNLWRCRWFPRPEKPLPPLGGNPKILPKQIACFLKKHFPAKPPFPMWWCLKKNFPLPTLPCRLKSLGRWPRYCGVSWTWNPCGTFWKGLPSAGPGRCLLWICPDGMLHTEKSTA